MAYRFVRARPMSDRLPGLRTRLDEGEVERLDPFGPAMAKSLNDARFDPGSGAALWVEEDYCTPPLAMEREVLDEYFTDLVVEENVNESEGWERIQEYPSLWDETSGDTQAPGTQ